MRKQELSPKERRFLAAYFRAGCNAKRAYLKVSPDVEPHTAETQGSIILQRIKKKTAGPLSLLRQVSMTSASHATYPASSPLPRPSFTKALPLLMLLTTLFACAPLSYSLNFLGARKPKSPWLLTCPRSYCNSLTKAEAMPQNSIVLRPSIPQARILRHPARFKAVNAGRRFGKTYLAIDFYLFPRAVNIPDSKNWYVAPTYKMAKDIAWEQLKGVVPELYIDRMNETELSVRLRNRSVIQLKGAEDPDSLRGPGLDSIVYDEYAFMKPKVWDVTRPMLSDREGTGLFISTPSGYNHFYDLYCAARARKDWAAFQFTTIQGGNVSAEEIAEARSELDERIFRQEYEASFEMLAGRVYYAYDRDKNVGTFSDDGTAPLLVGMDFNVNPMTAALAVRRADQIQFIGEIVIPNGNTEEMARIIKQRFPGRIVRIYPDPTGNARKTSAPVGQTDFTILRGAGFQVLAPSHPYPVADKINTANAAFCTADGTRRAFIDPVKCPQMAKAFDGLTYREGTNEPDKSLGLDHITDAAAYLMLWELPIKKRATRIKVLGV